MLWRGEVEMKYLGKLLLEGNVVVILVSIAVVVILHFFGDMIIEALGG